MENNENKKGSEALPDDALDKVTGGRNSLGEVFKGSNCFSCRHYENFITECPYGGPLKAVSELEASYGTQCPGKEA